MPVNSPNVSNNLLSSAYQLLPKHGWKSSLAVAFSQSNLKLSPSCLSGLYPQGQDIALVNHVRNHLCNVYSMQRMRSPTLKEMNLIMNIDYVDQGIKDKLAVLISGIYARAEFISKHSSLWPEALSILMKSSTIDILVKDPLDTADALLCQCDLQFSDLEWYSFRALLSKILLSTEIMICSSPDMHERDVEDLKIYITNRFKSYYLSRNSLSKVTSHLEKFANVWLQNLLANVK